MINKTFKLMDTSDATLTTYILQQDRFAMRGSKRPAVIVCPGGGYQFVSENEGEPVALVYARNGYCAFVLTYSVKIENPFPKSLTELAAAIKLVRENACEWGIDANDITIAGFSAGGHLAMSIGVFYDKAFLLEAVSATPEEIRPNALVLGYPAITLIPWNREPMPPEIAKMMDDGIIPDMRGFDITQILAGKMDVSQAEKDRFNLLNHVSKTTPPAFIWGSNQDTVIHPSDLWGLSEKLREHAVPYELHIFGRGPHGQGISDETVLDSKTLSGIHLKEWTHLSLKWLYENRNASQV